MTSGKGPLGNKIFAASIIIVVALLLAQVAAAYLLTPKAIMHLGGERFEVRIADNDRTRKEGLSGTTSLPEDQALLFVFDDDSRHGIWMKDMNYAIDIVWLDAAKKVVHIETGVPPDSYPAKVFFPESNARYVVEFTSGVVMKSGIKIGQEAVFSGTSRQI